MAFDELKERVDGLNRTTSGDARFKSVFVDIQSEVENAADDDLGELKDIVGDFRSKLPGRLTLNRLRSDAKDLHENIVIGNIGLTLDGILRRNEAINDLIAALDEESEQAVDDASLLDEIKEGIEKATKTVDAIKDMVNQLTESGESAIDNIMDLIDGVDEISSIFNADDA